LNLRLREAPPPPTTRRNPFNFGSRSRNATPSGLIAPARLDTEPAAAESRHSGFAFSLSGIGIAGELRTAVLTDGQNVRIVKVNDMVAEYTVVEITDSSVTLESSASRQILRLAQ